MKYLIASAVVLILIIAPLGSYLYLRSGFKYRMESVEQLKPKIIEAETKNLIDSLMPDINKVRLLYFHSDRSPSGDVLVQKVQDKIVQDEAFEILRFDMPSSVMESYKLEYDYYLYDTSGVLRNYYLARDSILTDLIRHLSVVIPIPKRKEIVLKRDQSEKN